MGAMTLAMMLYLAPSFARVSVKPTWPSLAARKRLADVQLNSIIRKHTRVVGLSEVTEETGSRGCVDDTAKLLFPEVRPSSLCAL